jgi:hypothetical protein
MADNRLTDRHWDILLAFDSYCCWLCGELLAHSDASRTCLKCQQLEDNEWQETEDDYDEKE